MTPGVDTQFITPGERTWTTRVPCFSRTKVRRAFERMARFNALKRSAPGRSTICMRIMTLPPLSWLEQLREKVGRAVDALEVRIA